MTRRQITVYLGANNVTRVCESLALQMHPYRQLYVVEDCVPTSFIKQLLSRGTILLKPLYCNGQEYSPKGNMILCLNSTEDEYEAQNTCY